LKKELANGCVPVRVLPAAEFGQFTEAAIAAFYSTPYEVTPQANRVGYRLKGTPLHTCHRLELRSHGIAPGTVQVPPAGQPIVQLAEANTCGGYPKIATVIESDLWRLAQTPVGCAIQFVPVTSNDGATAIRDHWDALGLVQCRLAGHFQA
jgi:allophanate hydrolase subunit 2